MVRNALCTRTRAVTKVLEFLVLVLEASIPHPNQSAYRKVSCGDLTFATQEVIGRNMSEQPTPILF